MLTLPLLFFFLTSPAITNAFAHPTNATAFKRSLTSSETGTSDGYYYSFYTDGGGSVTYNNDGAGIYDVSWTDSGDFVAGVGWATGSDRFVSLPSLPSPPFPSSSPTPPIFSSLDFCHNPPSPDNPSLTTHRSITFDADYAPSGNSYLAVYGWTTFPLIEYYILESYGTYDPGPSMTLQGSLTADGATYDVYTNTRTDAPSIEGTATFTQYWSIRSSKRTSGTVTTGTHFEGWEGLGLELGTFNYQIMATEGYESSGTSKVTVS